jgi:two-component system chemotaxis response regulator CheY
MNILLVEDNAVQSRIVERCLSERVNYEDLTIVRTAEDAVQALRGNASYDVLIIDWMLPGMSGVDLVRAVRGRETFGAVYIIMQTAKDRAEHVEKALDAGADNYVIKPLDCDSLSRKIAEHRAA